MGLQKTVFGRSKYKPNTFIGGISSTVNTPTLLATKLGISVSRIKGFRVKGADVECAIVGGTYSMKNGAWGDNLDITFFDDREGLVTSLRTQSFRRNSKFVYGNFPAVTFIDTYTFDTMPAMTELNIPVCTSFGESLVFAGTNPQCIITASLICLTNGPNGGPNAALVRSNCLVNYVGYVDDGSWNTEIKGVAAIDSSRVLISRRIGCTPSALLNYQVIGNDIRFKVFGTYKLLTNAFSNRTDITEFNDIENRVTSVGTGCISYCSNIIDITFNGCVSVDNTPFRNNSKMKSLTMNSIVTINQNYIVRDCPVFERITMNSLVNWHAIHFYAITTITTIYAPKTKYLGSNATYEGVWANSIKLNSATITVDRFMQTSNNGEEEGDIAYSRNNRGATIVYVDN